MTQTRVAKTRCRVDCSDPSTLLVIDINDCQRWSLFACIDPLPEAGELIDVELVGPAGRDGNRRTMTIRGEVAWSNADRNRGHLGALIEFIDMDVTLQFELHDMVPSVSYLGDLDANLQ